jgi:SAM-dependent methyltransferase
MIPTRTKASIAGLNKMIDYIDTFYDVSQLTILEVGSWAGTSANEFAKRFKHVTCVDPWEPTKGTITERQNVKEAEKEFNRMMASHDNITKIKGRIEDVYKKLPEFDVIYIDGEHTYKAVQRDIFLCWFLVKSVIAGHDYCGKFSGVVKAVNQRFRPDKIFSDSSWVHIKERDKING